MTPSFCLQRLRYLPVWLTLCFIALCFIVSPAHAQLSLKIGKTAVSDTVTTPRVQAQLVLLAPQGVAAGQPVELGLRITHQPDWHTYWKNAGDSGLPTQLDWQLPESLRAGDIAWPVPQQIRVGDLLNYGYEGTVLLPVPVQVDDIFTPDAQGMVDIRLNASWLVCRVECIPEEGQFHLRVAAQDSQALWAREFAAAHAQVPPTLEQAQASITTLPAGDRVSVRVAGLPAAALGQTLAFYPEASDTFQHAAVLGQDWTQAWEGAVWTAELPLSNMRGETPAQLAFVLGLAPSPTQAWRIEAPVQGSWSAVQQAQVSPALQAALEANRHNATTAPVPTDTSRSSWVTAIVGGLLGGLLLNLMPCVFPVLAIKLLGFARHGADARAQRASGLAYAAGVVISFLALGALLLALRAAGEQLGWGFQLQSPLVVAALAALFTLIGLNLAGMFEFAHVVPDRLANLHARHPLGDAFISGVVAVAIASPCTAPFMGASLGFAVAMPALQALVVFAALGVGMALPYVLVSWVPALLRWLPRPGVWMNTFRHAMAFPMFATVIWLVWVLGQQSGMDGAAALLALLLCLAALVWAITLHGTSRVVIVVLTLLLSGWLMHSAGPAITTPAPAVTASSTQGSWQAWSASRQAQLLAEGRPVFVDYTAAWCVTCQYNKRNALADSNVLADFASHNVALLRADWTRREPAITAALAQLGRNGVPVYVLLAPGKPPVVLNELLSSREVREAIATL